MIMKDDKGRWHVQYEKNYSICTSESDAKAKLALWSGEVVETPQVKVTVDSEVAELDTNNDGHITKEEISVRFP